MFPLVLDPVVGGRLGHYVHASLGVIARLAGGVSGHMLKQLLPTSAPYSTSISDSGSFLASDHDGQWPVDSG